MLVEKDPVCVEPWDYGTRYDFSEVQEVTSTLDLLYTYPSVYAEVESLLASIGVDPKSLKFLKLMYSGEVDCPCYLVYFNPGPGLLLEVKIQKIHENVVEKLLTLGPKDIVLDS